MQATPTLTRAASPSSPNAAAHGPADPAGDDGEIVAKWRPAQPRLSCVVPCWNESANLALLIPILGRTLAELAVDWEIIIVDDGSTDDTALRLAPWWSDRRHRVRLLQLSRNFGKEAALTAGIEAAQGDAVILMDGDMQHPPELLPTLVAHWRDGADMVYTVREDRADESAIKRVGTAWFYRLINAADRFEVPPGAGDFRLMDRSVVDALMALSERNRFMKGLYAWVGFDSVAVPYQPAERAVGESRYGLMRLLRLSFDGLTAFTTWPLRMVSAFGLVMALVSFSYGAWLTLSYVFGGNEVSGWTTIVVSLMLFSGMQMISLGVLGEYIGRVFEEVKARPLYLIKRDVGHGLQAPEEPRR